MNYCIKIFSWAVITALFISCTASKKTTSSELDGMQHVTMDTMMVHAHQGDGESGIVPDYKPAEERVWDLLHTALDLSFDWTKEAVIGKATLTLTPLFYTQSFLRLDAIDFEVHSISVNGLVIAGFHNNDLEIVIPLELPYERGDQLTVEIEYTAYPRPSGFEEGAAITSDQGLFFIDPLDTIPNLARQIWTQGETTNNSKWFPTLDQPNERGTQEIILTVADSLMTLSNGLLISSTPEAGGMRRDHWKLDLPHAPYLAMIAVGQWDKVTEYWRGRPVEYYVDPGYGPSAKAIFANTPEMIEFFSTKLGYDFVWPKYAQIIVKNFVSGAMENTTAVVFGDFIQFYKDEVIEEGTNEYIVAHELFHHWFGDLVTCESWANLALNEGFANYAEYLWQEYKYGRERADLSRMSELSGYYDETAYRVHPLVEYHFGDEREMFDAHSYNKGGLVLHMLREVVGDDAFFASLRYYLQQHAYGAAEVDDLRQAFEAVTGKDLHWFFNQWYFGKGHPVLEIKDSFDPAQQKLSIEITQTQDTMGYHEVFILPMEIAIYHQDSSVEIQRILLNKKSQLFSFSLSAPPLAVVIDPKDVLLAVVNQEVASTEYPIRVLSDLAISHRISALQLMEDMDPAILQKLMQDTSYVMRAMVISHLDEQKDAERLYALSLVETRPEIQYYLLETLAELDPLKAKELAIRMLEHTDKTPVIYEGLKAVAAADIDEAIHQAAHFQNHPSSAVYAALASIYAKKGNAVSLDFFTSERAAGISDDYLEEFIVAMALYMSGQPTAVQDSGLAVMDSDFFLKTDDPQYRIFYLITGLLPQFSEETDEGYQSKILSTIKSLYHKETDAYLKGVLKEGLGELLD